MYFYVCVYIYILINTKEMRLYILEHLEKLQINASPHQVNGKMCF